MICSVPGCSKHARYTEKKLCTKHYARLRKYGDVNIDHPVYKIKCDCCQETFEALRPHAERCPTCKKNHGKTVDKSTHHNEFNTLCRELDRIWR